MEAEFGELMAQVREEGSAFGHRQHIHLAWRAVRRYGMPAAVDRVSEGIREVAEAAGRPDKFHVTMTRAWVELVGHHVEAGPEGEGFETFVVRNPELLDKRLLDRFYRPGTLESANARVAWTVPDRASFPWGAAGPNAAESP